MRKNKDFNLPDDPYKLELMLKIAEENARVRAEVGVLTEMPETYSQNEALALVGAIKEKRKSVTGWNKYKPEAQEWYAECWHIYLELEEIYKQYFCDSRESSKVTMKDWQVAIAEKFPERKPPHRNTLTDIKRWGLAGDIP